MVLYIILSTLIGIGFMITEYNDNSEDDKRAFAIFCIVMSIFSCIWVPVFLGALFAKKIEK